MNELEAQLAQLEDLIAAARENFLATTEKSDEEQKALQYWSALIDAHRILVTLTYSA